MTDGARCCVCDRSIWYGGRTVGGRGFCADHCERIARENAAAAAPLFHCLVGVVLFTAVVYAVSELTHPTVSGPALVGLGVCVAIVPALFWLAAFYSLDRVEPEPKRYVLGVFALGALVAQGAGQPLIRDALAVQNWLYNSPVTGIVGSILVVGMVQEFLKYLVIRHTVYYLPEFDERVDGIIYGVAAGLGYATVLNIQYVVGSGGVDLGVGAIRVTVAALAQASFSGVVGYYVARAKFESMGPVWLPVGLVLAAVLNGLVSFALREAPGLGRLSFNPWIGLVLAVVVAAVTFAVLFVLIRRLNAETISALRAAGAGD